MVVFGDALNFRHFFLHIAQNTKASSDKHTNSTLEKCLNDLIRDDFMVDTIGYGYKPDIYHPEDLLELLDEELKNLPSKIENERLVVDFKNIKDTYNMPLGIKTFKIMPRTSNKQLTRRAS